MSAKNLNTKMLAYFPELNERATWEQAWEYLIDKYNLEADFYDKIETKGKKKYHVICLGVYKSSDLQIPDVIFEREFKGAEYDDIAQDGEYDWNKIYRFIVEGCIQEGVVKKPRNHKKLREEHKSNIEDLKKQRQNISCKISMWRAKGKDVTALLAEREKINKLIHGA